MRRLATTRAGFTLVEMVCATVLFLVVVGSVLSLQVRDTRLAQSTLAISAAETRAEQLLSSLQRELAEARGHVPRAVLTQAAGASATDELRVDSTAGFPDSGVLLVDRGLGNVERIAYARLDADGRRFVELTRGASCTEPSTHAAAAEVLWAGLAEPILVQQNPSAELFDGRVRTANGSLFFRGDGLGFSFRLPTDPSGGNDLLDLDGELRWGAQLDGAPDANGWSALTFAPKSTFDEAREHFDLNKDGDQVDVFDIGQIQKRTWSTLDPTRVNVLEVGPTGVLQERCNAGGDLDADGFDDPLFLWDAAQRALSVRLYVLGHGAGQAPVVRRVQAGIFLRNEPGT